MKALTPTMAQHQNTATRKTAVLKATGLFLLGWTALCGAGPAAGVEATVIALEGVALPGSGGDPVATLKAPFANDLGDLFIAGTLLAGGSYDGFIWTSPDQIPFRGDSLPGGATVSSRGAASNAGDWMVRTYSQGTHEMRSSHGVVIEVNDVIQGAAASHKVKQIEQPTMTADGDGFFLVQLQNLDVGGSRWAVMRADNGGATAAELEIDPSSAIDGYAQVGLGVLGFGVSDNGVHTGLAVQLDDKGTLRSSLAIDGQVVAMKNDRTGGANNEKWNAFNAPSMHSDGSYLGSASAKIGSSAYDVLAYLPSNSMSGRPSVLLAEGHCVGTAGGPSPCVTLEEDGSFKAAAFDSMDDSGTHAMAYLWVNAFGGPAAGAEYLLYACDAKNPADSHLILQRGDTLDLDGDGADDALVDRVGIPGQPDIAFGDSSIHVGADVLVNGEKLYAVLTLAKPECGEPGW